MSERQWNNQLWLGILRWIVEIWLLDSMVVLRSAGSCTMEFCHFFIEEDRENPELSTGYCMLQWFSMCFWCQTDPRLSCVSCMTFHGFLGQNHVESFLVVQVWDWRFHSQTALVVLQWNPLRSSTNDPPSQKGSPQYLTPRDVFRTHLPIAIPLHPFTILASILSHPQCFTVSFGTRQRLVPAALPLWHCLEGRSNYRAGRTGH